MQPNFLHKHPFLRLTIPWMAGVFCGYLCDSAWQWATSSVYVIFCLIAVAVLAVASMVKHHRLRFLFGWFLMSACFAGGWIRMSAWNASTRIDFEEEEAVYRVRLQERPEERGRCLRCEARLVAMTDSLHFASKVPTLWLYFAHTSQAKCLHIGSEVWILAKLRSTTRERGKDTDRYKSYLRLQGVAATAFVGEGNWQVATTDGGLSPTEWAAVYREKAVQRYKDLGFEGDALGILAALTLGERSELSEDVRTRFTTAGVAHILALSGLHMGCLTLLLLSLLRPLQRWGSVGTGLSACILIGGLWGYAFFTGLSPSVVRAACMCSLLGLGTALGRERLSLNVIAATAFFMLLIWPEWLMNVGFQLSFAAVLFIRWWHPWWNAWWHPRSRVVRSVWMATTVSLVAQLGTLPLVLHYFGTFPVLFLPSNLLLLPLVPFLLYVSILLWCVPTCMQPTVVALLKGVLTIFDEVVSFINDLPYAQIADLHISAFEVVCLYGFLWMMFCYCRYRRKFAVLMVALLFLLVSGVQRAVRLCVEKQPHEQTKQVSNGRIARVRSLLCLERDENIVTLPQSKEKRPKRPC